MEVVKVIDGEQHKAVKRFISVAVPVLLKANPNKRKDGTEYTGVHVVFGKFNTLFKEKFPSLDVRAVTKQLEAEQFIATVPCRGGAMLYLWANKPASYKGMSADPIELSSDIEKQLALLEASEAMDEAKANSTLADDELERLTAPAPIEHTDSE